MRRRSSPWSSVRARTTTAATVVVALVLTATGLLVLAALRNNLVESASMQAEGTAHDIVAQLDAGTDLARLRFPDPDDEPAQVVSIDGAVLAADEELTITAPLTDITPKTTGGDHSASGTGGGEGDEGEDEDDDDDDDEEDEDSEEGSSGDEPAEGSATGSNGGAAAERAGAGTMGSGGLAGAGSGEVTFSDVALTPPDADTPENFRVAALPATLANGQPVIVYAAASLETADSAVADARRAMLIGLPLLLAVVAAVTWLVTRRALRPVEAIRRELAEIMHGDLSRRVPEPRSRDEIGRLAATTNETLAALEKSSERQRRFIADAAHELRSPIASLRTQLEVAQAHPDLLEMDGVLGDTVRIQQLAADLLLLARLDAGEQRRTDRVDLRTLIEQEIAHRIGDRIPVACTLPDEAIEVAGSRSQLARVLGNLVDNAQRHAETSVRVGLTRTAGTAVIDVVDDGSGVPEADRERIFQRFVRLDEARSRDDGGAGLGLAIVRDVVERHEGVIRVEGAPQGGARFVVELPVV
ncbi:sensor histidine kinase [Nocardia cyriacigeorgica]|uniref:sensor histidine kinase n=1 Tax=Nocardia cyriacigeorgica TaxID=135487 RepID=UPI00189406CB|nr:HAMP domain-containing sensor histidine kinase [Nocardia cyriacigeorgica]MBF6455682.1 HAMP domain-containing histidine kinase [Nocardia cyriacigeorgica]MBF6480251.1 HAMP domain-containing histidine kinase [Nocardia cyriacigeorgica]MBF6553576.1 HAMP domain-containing histidine kinase [Nocardia cyriacigeorgica]